MTYCEGLGASVANPNSSAFLRYFNSPATVLAPPRVAPTPAPVAPRPTIPATRTPVVATPKPSTPVAVTPIPAILLPKPSLTPASTTAPTVNIPAGVLTSPSPLSVPTEGIVTAGTSVPWLPIVAGLAALYFATRRK